jgi:two-component system sensor histidine kinase YesM
MRKKIKNLVGGPTIGKRLISFIVVVVLIPTATVLALFYARFYKIVQESLLDSQVVTSLQAAKYINDTVETLLSVCDTIAKDERLPALLAASRSGGSADAAAAASAYETLRAVIDSHVISNSLSAIRIYTETQALSPNDSWAPLLSDIEDIRNTYWHGIFASQDIDLLFAPEYYLGATERTEYGDLAVIRKQMLESGNLRIPVYVAVYTYNDILIDPIQDIELESVEGIRSYIINSRETIVAQTDSSAYGTYAMSYADITQSIPVEGVFIPKEVLGASVFMTYRDIDSTDWRVAWIVPRASIMSQSRYVIIQFAVIYALMTILVLIIGFVMSNRIVGRIKFLRNQMRLIKMDRPEPLALIPGKDEVGELIETYNYMVERINTLFDDTVDAAEELNNVKIAALRAQIDPHFLYNTLDMIKWLIKAEDNEKASDAIVALSRFYRLTLNRGNLSAPVSAELEHVSLYIRLMNMRFDDKIGLIMDMPEDMLEYEIPLIIFQPIVENAIQHGIFEKTSKTGKIIITGWSDDEMLYFLISDDGIGIMAERISQLLLTKTENGTGSGIGVYNTHRRLQLMYGRDDCGLQFSSEYGKGTDVTFRIPKIMSGRTNGERI